MADAFHVLRDYLQARAKFSPEEMACVQSQFTHRSVASGDYLQRAGDIPTHAAFVTTGCLRTYIIDAKGKEHTVKFAPETWWLADNKSLSTHSPSPYFIQAIENSELLLITPDAHERLAKEIPGFGEAFRKGLQKHASAKEERIVSALSATAEERYQDFAKTYPSILTRVPQWMIASYLGLTPETLSRIRARLAAKHKPAP